MITRELLQALRTDIDAALASVAAKHNVSIKAGNASFAPTNATFKLEIAAIVDGNAITREQKDFMDYVGLHPFSKEDFGAGFTYGGYGFTISGYKPRKRLSLLATRSDGKVYNFDPTAIKRLISKES